MADRWCGVFPVFTSVAHVRGCVPATERVRTDNASTFSNIEFLTPVENILSITCVNTVAMQDMVMWIVFQSILSLEAF